MLILKRATLPSTLSQNASSSVPSLRPSVGLYRMPLGLHVAAPTSAEPEASFAHSRAVDAVILVPVVVVGAEPDVEQRQQTVLGSVWGGKR